MKNIAKVLCSVCIMYAGPLEALEENQLNWNDTINMSSYVFKGSVSGASNHYSAQNPKHTVSFQIEDEFFGNYGQGSVDFTLPGGYLFSEVEFVTSSATPRFYKGETYIIFVKKRSWDYSPVTNNSNGYFRTHTFNGKEVYVDSDGSCITNFDDSGFSRNVNVVDYFSSPLDQFGLPNHIELIRYPQRNADEMNYTNSHNPGLC